MRLLRASRISSAPLSDIPLTQPINFAPPARRRTKRRWNDDPSTSDALSAKRTKKGKGRAAAPAWNTLRDRADENTADGTTPSSDEGAVASPNANSRPVLVVEESEPQVPYQCGVPGMKFQWYYRKDTVGRHAEKCKGAKEGSQSTIFGQPLPRPGSVAAPATPKPSSSAGVSSERPPSAGPLNVSTVSSPLPSQSVTDAEQGTSDSLRIIATSPRLTVAESAEAIIEASVTTSAMSTPSTPSPGRQSAGSQQCVSPQQSPRLLCVDMLGTASPGTANITDDRTFLLADAQASTAVEAGGAHDVKPNSSGTTVKTR
ncbi:predicted protein [Postia placenta Mad-698-R]|nr:predicted protein [Postia placenta Mad-698-R]